MKEFDQDGAHAPALSRRRFLGVAGTAGAALGIGIRSPWTSGLSGLRSPRPADVLNGSEAPIDLTISRTRIEIDGRGGNAVTINGTVPGPVLRFREGDEAEIHVTNTLDSDTSIHWHGLIVPNGMDGVPGVNFPGISPGETFVYRFPVRQYGTYWYHSHSQLQEQSGHYGSIVIDPERGSSHDYDREIVVVVSDWTFEDPHRVYARLKKMPHYYNNRRRTISDLWKDIEERGIGATLSDRLEWGEMRMTPSDLADVTGATYTYLLNGRSPDENWTGAFRAGERVRLRFVNAAAATFFDVRIPGIPLSVVQFTGRDVRPVEVDEFRIAPAETIDIIVHLDSAGPYTLFAEAMDRSGYARGTLAVETGSEGLIPAPRFPVLLSMADMGMDHGSMDGMAEMEGMSDEPMDHEEHMGMAMPGEMDSVQAPGSVSPPAPHGDDDHGAANAGVPMETRSRLSEPGIGLGQDGWRVLTYADLRTTEPRTELRPPDREIELHLTGNMERFMWSIDGVTYSESEPIRVTLGERIRLILVNDTMMNHPMHLHGMWMELENGAGPEIPFVHTLNVKPAERVSFLVDADASGPWAFHCHVLYHMEAGMFRVFEVVVPEEDR